MGLGCSARGCTRDGGGGGGGFFRGLLLPPGSAAALLMPFARRHLPKEGSLICTGLGLSDKQVTRRVCCSLGSRKPSMQAVRGTPPRSRSQSCKSGWMPKAAVHSSPAKPSGPLSTELLPCSARCKSRYRCHIVLAACPAHHMKNGYVNIIAY